MATLKPLWLSMSDLAARLPRVRTLFVATDYDGTLTPIVDHPEAARLPARARAVLERLSQDPDVRVAVVSGRNLDDLRRQLEVPNLYLVGAAGLETETAAGERRRHLADEQALPGDLRSTLEAWCQRFPGSWVEDKEVAFALHYRGVSPDLQPAFGAGVRRRLRPFRQQATLVHGKRVFEVMPSVAWDKASGLELWMQDATPDSLVFFFGDDTNDETVYPLVRQRNGVAVAVGRTVSRAEYVLPAAQEVVWFLEWLEREWQDRANSTATALDHDQDTQVQRQMQSA